jgi:predicted SprT family Zn-dependent metalloprotease
MADIQLLSESELEEIYDSLNRVYFRGALPTAYLTWSTRLRIAGKCYPDLDPPKIVLSRMYHEHFPGDLEATIKHEMIHLKYRRHGKRFKAEARRVGALLHTREYPGLRRKPVYVYACPACGREYTYRRRVRNLACSRCSNGHYDSRFRLYLKRDLRDTSARKSTGQLSFSWSRMPDPSGHPST